jgi:ATP-dependent RNA helicase RhlE
VAQQLSRRGIGADAIHGNKSQGARQRAIAGFRDGAVRVLVATDIAARGIDIDGITHVINYDLPNVPETYVHRIGRTARAGAAGIAISFCDRSERPFLRDIEKLTRSPLTAVGAPESAANNVVAGPGLRGSAPSHHQRPHRQPRHAARPRSAQRGDRSSSSGRRASAAR